VLALWSSHPSPADVRSVSYPPSSRRASCTAFTPCPLVHEITLAALISPSCEAAPTPRLFDNAMPRVFEMPHALRDQHVMLWDYPMSPDAGPLWPMP
jgi:hypothetical protein